MSLAKTLWEENADLSRAALVHRFVRGLKEGSLPLGSFQRYIGQDAFFLEAFARAYALALAHSPDQEGLREFADLLSGVLEELELHRRYAAEWGVRLEDVSPGDATLAYTDFLLASAALGSVGLAARRMGTRGRGRLREGTPDGFGLPGGDERDRHRGGQGQGGEQGEGEDAAHG